jgi:hypothetical protein
MGAEAVGQEGTVWPSPGQTHYVINVAKPWHVAWWAEYFGVSEEVVLDAVRKVGDRADEVADFLRRPDEHHLKHQ